jgi:ligand-binding SRPBCC domain-containing protein
MKVYRLEKEQLIDIPIDISWEFFSNPKNLQEITPDSLSFNITSDLPEKVYPGLIILYKLKLLGFVPMNWVTEITQVREGEFFIDEQRFGPYKFWHHQHIFIEEAGKTRMKDIVHYGLPFGILGRIGIGFVNSQLEEIFSYRKKKLEEINFINRIVKETKK